MRRTASEFQNTSQSPEGPVIAASIAYRQPIRLRRFFAGLLVLICGWVAFAVYGQVVHGADIKSQVNSLTGQNAALRQQISDRQKEINEAQTNAWLEEQARVLGYVLPGEKIYVLTSPGASVPPGGGVSAPLPTFNPSPSPSATPTPAKSTSSPATPTPYQLTLGTPAAH